MAATQTSVVIVNWNGAEFLPHLLHSIQRETVAKIVVVDNHSADGSLEVLKQFPDVEVIANPGNAGYGVAANQGMQRCNTDFVLLLNVDLEAQPDAIAILQRHLIEHPEVSLVVPQLLFPNGELQLSIRSFPTPLTLALFLSFLDRIIPTGYCASRKEHLYTHDVDQPMGAAMMMRKSVLEQVGFFDPQFFLYMEEVDLCYRLKEMGHRIVYVHDARMIHHAGGSSRQDWARSQQNNFDSQFVYFNKHFPASTVRSLRILFPLALLFRSLVLLFTGRFSHSWFYFKEAFRRCVPQASRLH